MGMNWRVAVVILAAIMGSACQAEAIDENDSAMSDLTDRSSTSGTEFDKNHIVDDDFYRNSDYATAAQIKRFLEATPHKVGRSWLANAMIGDLPAPEAIVRVAREHKINPLMVLARMQVESSIVAKAEEPVGRAGQFALGCHKESAAYPNGLDPAVAALDVQLECGVRTMAKLFDAAAAGTNNFAVGKTKMTVDKVAVTPDNFATSALYSYTPFVLEGQGGNWLVWDVTTRYAAQFEAQNR
jgi:hypothetical protein